MCIAVLVPAGLQVKESIIRHCMKQNSDGSGMAYINKRGKVEVVRSASNTEEGKTSFIRNYNVIASTKNAAKHPMLLHFRIATTGRVNDENCHPFRIKDGVLIHNGSMFYGAGGRAAEKSDTALFAERYGPRLDEKFVRDNLDELEKAVAGWNKLAFLWDGGGTAVTKEKEWSTNSEGIMFSHGGWQPRNI